MSVDDELVGDVARYYADKVRRHGATHRGVDWNSTESQELRFDRLLSLVDRDASRFTINDFGCGYGGLATWLSEHGYDAEYVGFDVAPEMITASQELEFDLPSTKFTHELNDLDVADYTVASGVFNVRLHASDDEWLRHVHGTIAQLASLSRHGMSFNMLTSWSDGDRMRDYLYYADPARMFDHCKSVHSRHVSLLHDYGLWEFTIVVRFDQAHTRSIS